MASITSSPPATTLGSAPSQCAASTAARELLCGATLDIPLDKLTADPIADAVCEQLGDLALAIHMAAAYLAERPTTPLATFLASLQTQPLDHEALQALDQDSPTAHIQHIAQTIELSYRLLGDDEESTNDERPPIAN